MDLGARHLLGWPRRVAVLLAAVLLTQLGAGAATGADADRCARFARESWPGSTWSPVTAAAPW